jgi:leader peptidase (prepilin peptidase)/N-methyltransferase
MKIEKAACFWYTGYVSQYTGKEGFVLATAYFYFVLCLFGACIGSFLNVVVFRLPKGGLFEKSRSYCPACGETLRPLDLVPVISFLALKGKCRYCGEKISPRYPLVELSCAGLAAAAFLRFGFSWQAPLVFFATAILLAVALIDHDTMEIPDSLCAALGILALLSVFAGKEISLSSRFFGMLAVSVPMLLLALVIKGAFGGGDIKLMAACGFMLGLGAVLAGFFIAAVAGGIHAGILLLSGKAERGSQIAFGPHLCFGVAAALFFGEDILAWYLRLVF